MSSADVATGQGRDKIDGVKNQQSVEEEQLLHIKNDVLEALDFPAPPGDSLFHPFM